VCGADAEALERLIRTRNPPGGVLAHPLLQPVARTQPATTPSGRAARRRQAFRARSEQQPVRLAQPQGIGGQGGGGESLVGKPAVYRIWLPVPGQHSQLHSTMYRV